MVLPMAVFGAMKYFFGMTPAVMSLGILGFDRVSASRENFQPHCKNLQN